MNDAAVADSAEHLTATLPRGDAELVTELRAHLDDTSLRSAGATTIIEGDVRQP